MKKYFVSFVIQEKEGVEKKYFSDIVTFEEFNTIQELRELEAFLHEQWTGDENEEVIIINYREV